MTIVIGNDTCAVPQISDSATFIDKGCVGTPDRADLDDDSSLSNLDEAEEQQNGGPGIRA
ncbi:hypothetical protein Pst134EB_027482 [Puccinia striiformis f. sp. tritici]|nr:hypothetical protein Pst134EB_027482 [Puccinia striiformis f. sp. tritici]